MSSEQERFRVAMLDDYQNVALSFADWSVLDGRATVTVFNDHIGDSDAVVERLQPFDIVCVMRERAPMTRSIIERLPKLRLIASTAIRNASIDLKTAEERGAQVVHTGYTSAPTIELTWALILARAGNLVAENTSLRGGEWQQSVASIRSRCRSTICSARCRTCWQRRISATSPAPSTPASTRIRSQKHLPLARRPRSRSRRHASSAE